MKEAKDGGSTGIPLETLSAIKAWAESGVVESVDDVKHGDRCFYVGNDGEIYKGTIRLGIGGAADKSSHWFIRDAKAGQLTVRLLLGDLAVSGGIKLHKEIRHPKP